LLDNFLIGEIVSVHGVKGALKVRPLTDHPIRYTKLDEVKVILPKNSPKIANIGIRLSYLIEENKYKNEQMFGFVPKI
jgi:ribosomal 30S subunit maturation factor RimM